MDAIAIMTAISSGLSTLTLIGGLCLAIIVISLIIMPVKVALKPFFKFLKKNAVPIALIIALVATTGSLFYSEVMGFTPCKLCWYQRIFMYPQVILFAIALINKDDNVWKYALVLSMIGAGIAAYHYSLQVMQSSVPCSADGTSCSDKFIFAYGYITIPMMALTAFLMIISLILIRPKKG